MVNLIFVKPNKPLSELTWAQSRLGFAGYKHLIQFDGHESGLL